MNTRYIPLTLILAVILASTAATMLHAQLSDEEAQQKFKELGCISCHNGNIASDWETLIHEVGEEWPELYATIDEAAANLEYSLDPSVKFNNFDDLIKKMAENVGKDPTHPDIQALKSYFMAKFNEGKQAQPQADTGAEGESGLNAMMIAAIAVIVIVITIVALRAMRT